MLVIWGSSVTEHRDVKCPAWRGWVRGTAPLLRASASGVSSTAPGCGKVCLTGGNTWLTPIFRGGVA